VGYLEDLVKDGKSELGRFHALWTLEGMGKINPALLLEVLKNGADLLKITALRQLENSAANDSRILRQLEATAIDLADKASDKVALQLALSSI
jgi:hypothetical protein